MSEKFWVGIDMSKDSFYAAVASENCAPREWAFLPFAKFAHSVKGVDDFLAWLRDGGWDAPHVAGVCIEATGRFSEQWVGHLNKRLEPVCLLNPARPKAFASSLGIRDKSDRVDACVLALYGKSHQPRPMQESSPQERELRDMSRLRNALQQQCQANEQRLADGPSKIARDVLKKTIAALNREITRLEKAMEQLLKDTPAMADDYKRAQTVQGIGPKTATVILAEFGDLRNYKRGELVALAGLFPREYSSGTSVRKKNKLAKAGKPSVRAALYMCAMSAVRANPHLKQFAERLKAHGKTPMQILGAVMRKLLLLVRAVVVGECDYDPARHATIQ